MNLYFFKNPILILDNNNSFTVKVKELFYCICWMYLFVLLSSVLLNVIDVVIKYQTNISIHNLVLVKQKEGFKNISFLYLTFFGPVLEELIFRLNLNLKKINLFISMSLICLIFVGKRIDTNHLISISTLFKTISIIIIGFIIYFLFNQSILDNIKAKYYSLYFYSISIIFGLTHVFNFCNVVPNNLLIFAPLFVIPQIILGLFTGYLRLKNGFLWGIALHCIFNLPPTLIYFFNK